MQFTVKNSNWALLSLPFSKSSESVPSLQMNYLCVQVWFPVGNLCGDDGCLEPSTLPQNCRLPVGTSEALLEPVHSVESTYTIVTAEPGRMWGESVCVYIYGVERGRSNTSPVIWKTGCSIVITTWNTPTDTVNQHMWSWYVPTSTAAAACLDSCRVSVVRLRTSTSCTSSRTLSRNVHCGAFDFVNNTVLVLEAMVYVIIYGLWVVFILSGSIGFIYIPNGISIPVQ